MHQVRWPGRLASVLAVALVPHAVRAQQAPLQNLPPGYAGSAECVDCHQKQLTHGAFQ